MNGSARSIVLFGAVTLGAVGFLAGRSALGGGGDPAPKVRIGVFDSRAIAVAYVSSKHYTRVKDLKAEHEKAKAAGDKKKMAELEAAGVKEQKRLHFQGFGREPVDDILARIQDQLPGIAAEAKVVAIVPDTVAWAGPSVERVDVTDLLVKPFEPGEKQKTSIAELRKQKPIPAEEIAGSKKD